MIEDLRYFGIICLIIVGISMLFWGVWQGVEAWGRAEEKAVMAPFDKILENQNALREAVLLVVEKNCKSCAKCPDCFCTAQCDVQEKFFYPNHTKYADCNNLGKQWLDVWEGTSMQPFISGYNKLEVVKYGNGMTIRQGNIIVFGDTNKTTVHAVIGVYPDYVLTQGYNNKTFDTRIGYDKIKYIVVGVRFC